MTRNEYESLSQLVSAYRDKDEFQNKLLHIWKQIDTGWKICFTSGSTLSNDSLPEFTDVMKEFISAKIKQIDDELGQMSIIAPQAETKPADKNYEIPF